MYIDSQNFDIFLTDKMGMTKFMFLLIYFSIEYPHLNYVEQEYLPHYKGRRDTL